MSNLKKNQIRASVALTINGDINFYMDDYTVSDELFAKYQELVDQKEEELDVELDDDLLFELDDILGVDFDDPDNEYSYEKLIIYNPNNLQHLKSRYVGQSMKPGYLGVADKDGFASFSCVVNYMDGYDANVYIRIKTDENGVIQSIEEPYTEITSDGIPYEVFVDLYRICDELDYACGINL